MPGKVNPVIPEAVNMVAAQVIGHDATIAVAGLNGNLDLNVMMPVIAYALLEASRSRRARAAALAEKCVRGIKANVERCRDYAERSLALVTALAPMIGYERAAAAAKKVLSSGKTVREALLEEKLIDPDKIDEILDLDKLARGNQKI